MQPPDLGRIDLRLASLVDAARLAGGDPLPLPLAAQVGFELGKDLQHVEEGLAGGRRCIDRLLDGLERDALGAKLMDEVLEILERARQPVDAGDATRALGLSLGDRACLALTAELGATALTADQAWGRPRWA